MNILPPAAALLRVRAVRFYRVAKYGACEATLVRAQSRKPARAFVLS
jgi:hypothetical protein